MKPGHGSVGRRVRYAGMEWTIRYVFGTHLELRRGRQFKVKATVLRSEVKFVRGRYEVKRKPREIVVRSSRGL